MRYIFRLYIVLIMATSPLFSKDNEIHELYRIVMNPAVFETADTFKKNVLDFCTTAQGNWSGTHTLSTQKSQHVYYSRSSSSLSSASTAPAYSGEQIENAQAGENVCHTILLTWNRRVQMATDLYHFLDLCDKIPHLTKKTCRILELPADKTLKDWQPYPELDGQLMRKKNFWLQGMPELMITANQNADTDDDEDDDDDDEAVDHETIDPTDCQIGDPAYIGYKKQIVEAFQRTITIESNYATTTQTKSTVDWLWGQVSCKTASVVRKATRYMEKGVICNEAKTFDMFQPNIAHLWGKYLPNFTMLRDFVMSYHPERPSNSHYTSQYIKVFLAIDDESFFK